MHNLGKLYLNLGQYDRAEPLLAESAALARRLLNEKDPGRGMSIQSHGECLLALGLAQDASALLLEAYGILSPVLAPDHPGLRRLCRSLAAAYEQLGDPSSAAAWKARAGTPPQSR